MDASTDGTAKRTSLEDLTKEELVIKCKNFLSIAQKAKQSKDALAEENRKLKEQLSNSQGDPNAELIIKTLTQQKLDLLTSSEELRTQKVYLDNKFREAEKKLYDLDTTNQGLKRQVTRLTEENENLISQLDELEKQIEELKKIGLEQQQQLLVLEKNNISKDFHGTNNPSLEENNLLKNEVLQLREKLNQKDKNVHQLGEELIARNNVIQNIEIQLKTMENEHLKCESEKSLLKTNFENLEKELLLEKEMLRKEHLNCASEKHALETDLKETKKRISDLETELRQSKEEIISKNDLIKKLETDEYSKYASEINLLENNLSKELIAKDDLIRSLETELKALKKELLECTSEKNLLENDTKKFKEDLTRVEKELIRFDGNNQELSKEVVSKDELIKNLEAKLQAFEKEHLECASEKNQLENNFEQLKEKYLDVEKDLYEVKMKSRENNEMLSQELIFTNDVLKNVETNLKALEKEHSNCIFEKKLLRNDSEKLNENNLELSRELISKNDLIQNLETEVKTLEKEHLNSISEKRILENDIKKIKEEMFEIEKELYNHKTRLLEKSKEIEKNNNLIDDLNTELHKYRALSEKLHQDVQTSNSKLADNQIVSSGVASDLENANDKLKEKLRSYHGKIVKFAGDIKKLKESKNELIYSFKTYTNQVNEWKALLNLLAKKIENNCMENEKVKQENYQLHQKILELKSLDENNKSLKEEVNSLKQKLSLSENDIEKVDDLPQNYALKQSQLSELESKSAVTENVLGETQHSEDTLSTKMNHIKSIFQLPRDDLHELAKENEQMCHQITELRQREQKFLMRIDMLKGHVNELNQAHLSNEKLQARVQELLGEVSDLNKTIDEVNAKEEKYQHCIKHYECEIESLSKYRSAVEELSEKIRESELNSNELATLNADLKAKIREHETALKNCVGNIERLECANDDLNRKIKENDVNQTELKCVNRDLFKNIDEYKSMVEQYLKDIDKLAAFNNESNHKIHLCEIRSCELQTENKDLTNKVKSYENLVEKYSRDIRKLENQAKGSSEKICEIEPNTAEITKLRTANEDLSKKLRHYEEKLEQCDQSIRNLDQVNQELSKKLTKYHTASQEYDGLKTLNEDLNEKIKIYSINIQTLQDQNESLSKQIDKSRSEEIQLAEKTSEEIIKQVNKNRELGDHIKTLKEEIDDIKNKPKEEKFIQTETNQFAHQEDGAQFEDKIAVLKRENAELLSEMNVMNQALKERGEVISKQQAYCEEILKKMQLFEAQNAANLESLMRKEETIEVLQRELNLFKSESCASLETEEEISKKKMQISRLKSEVVELKEKISQPETSEYSYPDSETMSTLSVISKAEESSRMKDIEGSWEERYGKLRNLAIKLKAKIRQLTEEITKEQAEKNDLQQKLAKVKQSYQLQIDLLQDQLEASSKEGKVYLKKFDAIAIEVSNDKKKLAENEDVIYKLRTQLDNLEKDKQNTEDWKKKIGAKVQTLKRELEANNVLKKEYENKIAKLNLDLEAKDKALKQEIERHNETKASLLEFTNERKKQSVLNLEIQDYERSVRDLSQKIEKKQELISKLKTQIDGQKASLDSLQEQSRAADDNVKMFEEQLAIAHRDNELHKRKIMELQAALSEKEIRIQNLTYSVENIRMDNEDLSTQLSKSIVEHEKNHSVLRQECELYKRSYLGLEDSLRVVRQQLNSKEHELEEIQTDYESYKVRAQSVLRQNQSRDLRTEERLKEESASLRAQVDILTAELEQCKVCAENLSHENTDLLMQNQEITDKLENTTAELVVSRKELERLSLKHQQMVVEHTETVRGLKLHGDTLAQCYRQQLSDQEDRHHREIIDLQSRIERGSTPPEFSALVMPSMPREEGEGSESVDSAAHNLARPVPLEKLLSSETEQETYAIKQQLSENEAKVAHLTALLADTEQDLAKHVQMNKLLKEEIRRQQRSVEREKHAENLEYLKNVMYKFLTLGHGDERERLVPVLNTILKLSPEETQKLTSVAKGEKTWSNYLPLWKPQ